MARIAIASCFSIIDHQCSPCAGQGPEVGSPWRDWSCVKCANCANCAFWGIKKAPRDAEALIKTVVLILSRIERLVLMYNHGTFLIERLKPVLCYSVVLVPVYAVLSLVVMAEIILAIPTCVTIADLVRLRVVSQSLAPVATQAYMLGLHRRASAHKKCCRDSKKRQNLHIISILELNIA